MPGKEFEMFDKIRKEVSKHRKPPITNRKLDIMEHRFWLFKLGVDIKYLDHYSDRFERTFLR